MALRPSVDRWLGELYQGPWERYFESKKSRGHLHQIDEFWIDVPNLIERRFTCRPTLCSPGLRKKNHESCCAEFTVELTEPEIEKLARVFDGVSAYLAKRDPHWKKGQTIRDCIAPHPDNRFQFALAKRKKRCVFGFLDEEGAIRCGVHGYALEQGIDVHRIKPKLCFLFPLLMQEMPDGTWFLTVIDEENADLIGFSSFQTLDCLHGKRTFGTDGPSFFEDHRGTLRHLFGKKLVVGLERIAQSLQGASPPLVRLNRKRAHQNER